MQGLGAADRTSEGGQEEQAARPRAGGPGAGGPGAGGPGAGGPGGALGSGERRLSRV